MLPLAACGSGWIEFDSDVEFAVVGVGGASSITTVRGAAFATEISPSLPFERGGIALRDGGAGLSRIGDWIPLRDGRGGGNGGISNMACSAFTRSALSGWTTTGGTVGVGVGTTGAGSFSGKSFWSPTVTRVSFENMENAASDSSGTVLGRGFATKVASRFTADGLGWVGSSNKKSSHSASNPSGSPTLLSAFFRF